MQTIPTSWKGNLFLTGIISIVFSLVMFSLPLVLVSPVNNFNYFIVNFLVTIFYFIFLVAHGGLKRRKENVAPIFLFLILFLVSAYSLNRELNVFENSTSWLSVSLVIVCTNYAAFYFFETLPRLLKYCMCFILGIGWCIFIYLSVYLVPIYLLSAIGFFLLGVSLHAFVPLLFVLFTIRLIKRTFRRDKKLLLSFFSGIASVITLLVTFTLTWLNTMNGINKTYRYATATNDNLPSWVSVAQTTPASSLTEKIFKTGLVYSVPGNNFNSFLWRMPNRSFDEQLRHDPLVMSASLFTGPVALEENERIKVLESQYDSRHQAQERLWSGENLKTTYVNTNVHIWQQFSIAYTEKTITVSNVGNTEQWSSGKEAIYTFHLPEGSVVSALSLWINGKEEKGLLTTKEKAAIAYKTIVGIESRDPSVVQWQEGNTVSVRVFPVVAGKSRVFKLGISAPLRKCNNNFVYDNVYFDGPSSSAASEDVTVVFDHKQPTLTVPSSLKSLDQKNFIGSGDYCADWNISLPYELPSSNGFCFNGKLYSVSEYKAERAAASFRNVYLDVNSSWTRHEFEEVYNMVRNKNVYIYRNNLIRVDAGNKDRLYDEMGKLQFSLFPFYEIADSANSLVISKSTATCPDFKDLDGSAFSNRTKDYLATSSRLKLFNIGPTLSPYLKTLLEYRVFDFEQGDTGQLHDVIQNNMFTVNKEDSDHVVVYNSEMVITKFDESAPSEAPDDLMRLFVYNHIMRNAGKKMIGQVPEDDEMVKQAKAACIVTPLSSLVVLETKEDYDRFKIAENINSLGNASSKSKGSVPEPHEWLLILTALSVLLYIRYKPFAKKIKSSRAAR